MIPIPIHKVLSTIQKHQLRALLMGGQACVIYGSAEFSRDVDFAILADDANLVRLQAALDELQAQVIAVPPFEQQYLREGLAVHFRCSHPDANGVRVDVMSKLRGVADFAELWDRRTSLPLPDGTLVELLSVADLVQDKKTQRDKDWPMIARLVEVHFQVVQERGSPTAEQIEFWCREARTVLLLKGLVENCGNAVRRLAPERAVLQSALAGDDHSIRQALRAEEDAEREADRLYWLPLRARLEELRRARREVP